MRHRTPLVVALVLVVGGLAGASSTLAQAPDPAPDEACDYSYSYQETSDGFEIVEKGSIVVGPGGEQAEVTAHPRIPQQVSDKDCRATTRETTGFSVDKDDREVIIEVELDYDPGESVSSVLPVEVQQNNLDLRLLGPDGTVASSEDPFDGGFERIIVDSGDDYLPAGRYVTEVTAAWGSSSSQISIDTQYI